MLLCLPVSAAAALHALRGPLFYILTYAAILKRSSIFETALQGIKRHSVSILTGNAASVKYATSILTLAVEGTFQPADCYGACCWLGFAARLRLSDAAVGPILARALKGAAAHVIIGM